MRVESSASRKSKKSELAPTSMEVLLGNPAMADIFRRYVEGVGGDYVLLTHFALVVHELKFEGDPQALRTRVCILTLRC